MVLVKIKQTILIISSPKVKILFKNQNLIQKLNFWLHRGRTQTEVRPLPYMATRWNLSIKFIVDLIQNDFCFTFHYKSY